MIKVICELGINHNGSTVICKKLIKQAYESGSWGIKFQYRNLNNYFFSDAKQTEIGKEIIDKEINKNYLSPSKIKSLSQYAKKLNLHTGISFFSSSDIKDFKNYKFDFYKIPSAASDNICLLKSILSLNKLTLISLGGRTLSLIKKITENIPKNSTQRVVLLHCVSNYPLNIINSKLGFIDVLKKKFKDFRIGYSSHENQIYNCIYVLSKKIDFIERHITLDKKSEGIDHSSSSEYKDFKLLNFYIKNLNIIDNKDSVKNINQGELLNIQNLGSSYIFNKNVKANTILKKNLLKLSQPKIGIDDFSLSKYLGKKLKKDVKINTPLTSDLFNKFSLLKKHNLFINEKKLSIPIRPHDYIKLSNEIKGKYYELHLSFKDVKSFNKNSINKNFLKKNFFSVHAPDYVDENNILDLFSKNKKLRKTSLQLLTKCLKICKYITSINKKKTNLIISISKYDNKYSKNDFYKKVLNFTKKIKKIYNVQTIPQWLPVYAWYFGGSEKINIFSNPDDLAFINKIRLKICLDTSHFLLSCNYYNKNPDSVFFKNLKIYEHFHLSDAEGIFGEGVSLGSGGLFKTKLFKYIINQKIKNVVLETWQGHNHAGLGFKKDIKKLYSIFDAK
jgi:N-acetylneuraminate synthase